MVARPDARSEPVLDAVCPSQRFRFIAELLDGDNRTEDLVLDHLVVLLEVCNNGRLEPEAAAILRCLAAGSDAGVRRCAFDEATDAIKLRLADYRTHVGVVVERIAVDGSLRCLGECVNEIAVEAGGGNHAR
ncbi:unannotated protein [freshwater metagenome]|uniref:Unannotated protein n=1 Tax=freshwater metagenome TaxID=449393 RepID=A0A6J5ZYE8_9ZZZZ